MSAIVLTVNQLPRDESQADEFWAGSYLLIKGTKQTVSYWFAGPDWFVVDGVTYDWPAEAEGDVDESARLVIMQHHGII